MGFKGLVKQVRYSRMCWLVGEFEVNWADSGYLYGIASVLSLPARIFPIYFPMGNMTTGFFVILSLIAGVVGFTTSLTGLNNIFQWDAPNLHAAAMSSLTTWALTLLAMGSALSPFLLSIYSNFLPFYHHSTATFFLPDLHAKRLNLDGLTQTW